jgi:hypothetical protein
MYRILVICVVKTKRPLNRQKTWINSIFYRLTQQYYCKITSKTEIGHDVDFKNTLEDSETTRVVIIQCHVIRRYIMCTIITRPYLSIVWSAVSEAALQYQHLVRCLWGSFTVSAKAGVWSSVSEAALQYQPMLVSGLLSQRQLYSISQGGCLVCWLRGSFTVSAKAGVWSAVSEAALQYRSMLVSGLLYQRQLYSIGQCWHGVWSAVSEAALQYQLMLLSGLLFQRQVYSIALTET